MPTRETYRKPVIRPSRNRSVTVAMTVQAALLALLPPIDPGRYGKRRNGQYRGHARKLAAKTFRAKQVAKKSRRFNLKTLGKRG